MATNLTPEQLAEFTSYLTPETLNQIYGGLADPTLPGGIRANLGYEWDSMEAQVAGGPGRATLTGYSGPIGADDMYNAYSPTGEFLGRYQADNDDWKALLPIVLAVGGHFLFGGGLGGAGAAGAAGASTAVPGTVFNAALDSQLANLALGSEALAGYTAAGAIPTAVNIGGTLYSAGAPVSSLFNAAADSQIANEAIAAAGGDPLVGYLDPSLTPATVQIGNLTYGAGAPVVTATGAPAPTGGTPTGGGGGTTTTPGGLPPGVTDTITKVLTNPNTLTNLLGLFGGGALGGGSPSGPGSVPTQGVPMNTPEYFNQVQGFLNQYLPGQMPTQSQYLSSWYNNTPGSYMPPAANAPAGTGGGGMMSPPAPTPTPSAAPAPAPASIRVLPPPTAAPVQKPPVSLEGIRGYLSARPGLTDQEIAAAMQQYEVSPQQMAEATGVPYEQVLQRYQAALGTSDANTAATTRQPEINWEALNARGITSPEWMNVSLRDLVEKSGYSLSDKAALDRAQMALYGNVGANMDTRDWAAIMASDNPLAAAEAALARMYSDPNFRAQNAEWLASQGYPEASAPLTYAQMVGRTGASYTPTAAEAAMIAQEINKITSAAGGGYHQAELAGPAQVLANAGYAVDPGYKPYLNQPLQTAQPVNYGGLSAQSSASDIAQAYKQFTGGATGDTVESRNAAIQYLQKIGIDPSRIGEAYSLFKA